MVRWAPRLGPHVTLARFDGGMHDLVLSGAEVRARVFEEVGRWVRAFVAPPLPAAPLPAPDGASTTTV
jgi:hypothetical protein